MADIFGESSRLLTVHSATHSSCLVAYSGGKDSQCVMDMAVRHFKTVVGFHMYLVPGLKVIEDRLSEAEERWGIEIVQYPHWGLITDIKNRIYCPASHEMDKLPKWKQSDIYAMAREETGIQLVLTGDKKSDFVTRRAAIKTNKDQSLLFPIADWHDLHVFAYLKSRNIEPPKGYGKVSHGSHSGVDLTTDSLLWLHDEYPADFCKLEQAFPFIRAAVKRREWYE